MGGQSRLIRDLRQPKQITFIELFLGAVLLVAVSPVLVGQAALLVTGVVTVVLAGIVGWDPRYAGLRPGEQALSLRL
ncbi:hypothetical protein ACI2K4_10185 [Micromonospora sp. NPDC050397]|uniref:hypothetical protein n=1 Tax=Micromonospora sp. NPDC050397 TaxID=3364279 RepID=UPI00384DC01A